MAVTGVEPISGGSKPPILNLCTIPLWTTCGIRTPPSQCKCEVLPSYTTRPIFGGRGETRTHLPRRPIRRFDDAGWFYRPVPLLSHNFVASKRIRTSIQTITFRIDACPCVYSCTQPLAARDTVVPHCQVTHITHFPHHARATLPFVYQAIFVLLSGVEPESPD